MQIITSINRIIVGTYLIVIVAFYDRKISTLPTINLDCLDSS